MKAKKLAAVGLCMVMALCGCGGQALSQPESLRAAAVATQGQLAEEHSLPEGDGTLLYLGDGYRSATNNDKGFFMTELVQDETYANLMFYDYQSLEQRYWCAEEGCAHNHAGCTSYKLYGGSCYVYGDTLFYAYADYGANNNYPPLRLQVYTGGVLEKDILLSEKYTSPDKAFCDGQFLYIEMWEALVRVDMQTLGLVELCPMGEGFTDEATGQYFAGGAYEHLVPVSYNGALLANRYEAEGGRSLVSIDKNGRRSLVYHCPPGSPIAYDLNEQGRAYGVDIQTGNIHGFDLATGQETLVTDAFARYNEAVPAMSSEEDVFLCASWWWVTQAGEWLVVSMSDYDPLTSYQTQWAYLYHLQTGEIRDFTLGDYYFGVNHTLQIVGETPLGLLVIEDTREFTMPMTGTGGEPYMLDTVLFVHALIDIEDLAASSPAYRTIEPVKYIGQ